MPQGNTEKILQAVDRFKVSSLLAGSHHVMRMAAMADKFDKSLDLTALKMVLPIGSNVSSDAYEKLVKIFPKLVAVPNAYGMTEFGSETQKSEKNDLHRELLQRNIFSFPRLINSRHRDHRFHSQEPWCGGTRYTGENCGSRDRGDSRSQSGGRDLRPMRRVHDGISQSAGGQQKVLCTRQVHQDWGSGSLRRQQNPAF